ncbi:hypothetical protein KCTC32516_01250 [Polaribacter huanghezhanensis]|nr:hypothetical protein KCTC32516_01250 [Polaribacter huanghezhanensis]
MSSSVIPPPNGADVTSMEGLKESLHLFEPKHFFFPFLAHAIGTLVGAIVTDKIAATKKKMTLIVGCIFLVFGTINVFMLPAPMWFNAVDLIFAYIPMALLASKISSSKAGL